LKKKQHKKPKIEYIDDGNFWPRKAALRILSLDTRAEMDAAILQVPVKFQRWVRDYINDWAKKTGGLTQLKQRLSKNESI